MLALADLETPELGWADVLLAEMELLSKASTPGFPTASGPGSATRTEGLPEHKVPDNPEFESLHPRNADGTWKDKPLSQEDLEALESQAGTAPVADTHPDDFADLGLDGTETVEELAQHEVPEELVPEVEKPVPKYPDEQDRYGRTMGAIDDVPNSSQDLADEHGKYGTMSIQSGKIENGTEFYRAVLLDEDGNEFGKTDWIPIQRVAERDGKFASSKLAEKANKKVNIIDSSLVEEWGTEEGGSVIVNIQYGNTRTGSERSRWAAIDGNGNVLEAGEWLGMTDPRLYEDADVYIRANHPKKRLVKSTGSDSLEALDKLITHSNEVMPHLEELASGWKVPDEEISVTRMPENWDELLTRHKTDARLEYIADTYRQRFPDAFTALPMEPLRSELGAEFDALSDQEKFDFASKVPDIRGEWIDYPIQEYRKLSEGKLDPFHGNMDDLNFRYTHEMIKHLREKRMRELLDEKGLTNAEPDQLYDHLWFEWKKSSTTDAGVAMQVSVAEFTGGHNRMTGEQLEVAEKAFYRLGTDVFGDQEYEIPSVDDPEEELRLSRARRIEAGKKAMIAYVQSAWETAQYVLKKAGVDNLDVYRGIILDRQSVLDSGDVEEEGFYKLPNIGMQKNGAASFTTDLNVANNWSGVGTLPPDGTRVILRANVPRESVILLPTMGGNTTGVEESVIAGTHWNAWDLWNIEAPPTSKVPIK